MSSMKLGMLIVALATILLSGCSVGGAVGIRATTSKKSIQVQHRHEFESRRSTIRKESSYGF